jgi:group I intron endonuclease
MIGVYQIEINGKLYVGSTTRGFEKRWKTHLYKLRNNKHENLHLQRAFNKYGKGAIIFSVLEVVESPEEVIHAEQRYIDKLNPLFNICPTAGNCLGRQHTKEMKEKMSKNNKGKCSEATLQNLLKMAEERKGKKRSEEIKQKISQALTGHPISESELERMKSFRHSDETKAKMSIAKTGGHLSEEQKQKLREASMGRRHTEEAKEKMRGKVIPEEIRQKTRDRMMGQKLFLGHKQSEEAKKKISEARRKQEAKKNER